MTVELESLDDLRVLLQLVHETLESSVQEIGTDDLNAAAAMLAPHLITPSPALLDAIPKISDAFARHKAEKKPPPPAMPASTEAKETFQRFKVAYPEASRKGEALGPAFASFIANLQKAKTAESDSASAPTPANPPAPGETWAKLRKIQEKVEGRVAGNRNAIEVTLDALARMLVRREDKDRFQREVTSLLFVGPPGVGKTSLASALSAAGEEVGLPLPCRVIPMSRYTHPSEVAELTGYGSQYQGGMRPGRLTGWVADRKGAPCIVVLDEVDRACISAQNVLLELLGEGQLTDTALPGQPAVDFGQVLLILTSNAGESLWGDPTSSGLVDALDQNSLREALRKSGDGRQDATSMSPAFLDRVDQIVVYRYFSHHQRKVIAEGAIERLRKRLGTHGVDTLRVPNELLDHMALHAGVFATGRAMGELVRQMVERPILRRIRRATSPVGEVSVAYADPDQQSLLAGRIASSFPCILHVDDEPTWRDAVARVVQTFRGRFGAPIRLESAPSVGTAREMLAAGLEPSVVLLDLCFPEEAGRHQPVYLPGLHLLAEIRRRLPRVPVVVVSTKLDDESDEMYARCVEEGGAAGFVPKQAERFQAALEETLLSLGGEALARNLQSGGKRISLRLTPDMVESHLRLLVESTADETCLKVEDAGWFEVQAGGTRFEDLCGIDPIVEDLRFAVEMLRDPFRFADRGIHPPQGILLHGPPGTGKTSIARALASEASAMFVSCVATQFESKWVGEGPARVRELFRVARRYAPVIVFIDELDSLGNRGAENEGAGARSLLNTLLAEMDGFRSSRGILFVGATNRISDLDEALVRPGRLGKKILVDRPMGENALRAFVALYFERRGGFSFSEDTRSYLARLAIGMSPAEIEEWARQTAWYSVRSGNTKPVDADLRQLAVAARTAVLHGDAQASQPTSRDELQRTAVHEAGHALVATRFGMPIVQLTIIARGVSLGFLEQFQGGPLTRAACIHRLAVAFAGKEAEEIVVGDSTVGASSDMEFALRLATNMVTAWGMGPEGIPRFADDPVVKTHAAKLLEEARASCRHLLETERPLVESLANALMERKTLLGDEIEQLLGSPRSG